MAQIHNILENKPHLSGEARCLACGHTWAAVAPTGTACLECPACATLRGVFVGPPMRDPRMECACGCAQFTIGQAPSGGMFAMCLHCAAEFSVTLNE